MKEYIIQQCLPTCKALWDTNLETFIASNNKDEHLYVLLTNISEQKRKNRTTFPKYKRFFFEDYRLAYDIKIDEFDKKAMRELLSLTQTLEM